MDLSPEDSLRLNVMLANRPQAIRIDESRMVVYALSDKGEMEIPLNPTGRDERYVKRVRELLSGHVLGSPSGYPVHIQRWARMGDLRNENIEDLLLLGEPEAVVAVVYSAELTDELARRAWWAMEDAENARQMLRVPAVVHGKMGPHLAHYLVEFLPFETEAEKIMETAQLVLQPGLIDRSLTLDLWKRAKRKNALYVGFLATLPDALPENAQAHPLQEPYVQMLAGMAAQGNRLAGLMARVLSPTGQMWLLTLKRVLEKPLNQDVVNRALDVAAEYFSAARPTGPADATIEELKAEAGGQQWSDPDANEELAEVIGQAPDLLPLLKALRVLSGSGYGVVRPVFCKTDAIGTLMRRKLIPVMGPYLAQVDLLLGE